MKINPTHRDGMQGWHSKSFSMSDSTKIRKICQNCKLFITISKRKEMRHE